MGPRGRSLHRGTLRPGAEAVVTITGPAPGACTVTAGQEKAAWRWLGPELRRLEATLARLEDSTGQPQRVRYCSDALTVYRENILRGHRFDTPDEVFLHSGNYVREQFALAGQIIAPLEAGKWPNREGLHPQSFRPGEDKAAVMRYWLFLPAGYEKSGDKQWPTILSLHGAGGRGENVELARSALHEYAVGRENFPFIIISPQCPADGWWPAEPTLSRLKAFVDRVVSGYRVDESRLYLAGSSMGGYGTWKLAGEWPNRFAAIAPICGGGDPKQAESIKHVPVWVFHGGEDRTVPIEQSRAMVEALRKLGAEVRFTVFPDVGHNAWTPAYNEPRLYEWLLAHRRPTPAP
jgi:dipeptidyl aminopeptidase/acylaminoacyl peptidase